MGKPDVTKICLGCGRQMLLLDIGEQPRGSTWTCGWCDCPVLLQEYKKDGALDYVKLHRSKRWIRTHDDLLTIVREELA